MRSSVDEKEFHRVQALRRALAGEGVATEVAAAIMEGGSAVGQRSSPEVKSRWIAEAMRRMDALMDEEARRRVREACSCCLGGKRRDAMLAVAKEGGTMEERLAAVERAGVVAPIARRQPDGRILVRFGPEGRATFDCPCIKQAEERISLTYCQCCAGHVRRHLETPLERKLVGEVLTSILNSGGEEGCSFRLTLQK